MIQLTFIVYFACFLCASLANVKLLDVNESVSKSRKICFISHGCWGGHTRVTQHLVADLMGVVAAKNNVSFIIAAGDNFYLRGVRSVNDPLWKEVFQDVYTAPSLQVPWLVALGNHDYRGDYMAQVQYGDTDPRWVMPHTYYARRFEAASLIVIVLDAPLLERCYVNSFSSPRCWDSGAQETFLFRELIGAERDKLQWKIIVCHYPMYANGPHINHKWLINLVEPMMARFGVQLYINADNHYLQVSEKDGRYFLNSGGGGGYSVHTAAIRGYRKNPHSKFIQFTLGPALHCIDNDKNVMTTDIYTINSTGHPVFSFKQKPKSGKKLTARMFVVSPHDTSERDSKERHHPPNTHYDKDKTSQLLVIVPFLAIVSLLGLKLLRPKVIRSPRLRVAI